MRLGSRVQSQRTSSRSTLRWRLDRRRMAMAGLTLSGEDRMPSAHSVYSKTASLR